MQPFTRGDTKTQPRTDGDTLAKDLFGPAAQALELQKTLIQILLWPQTDPERDPDPTPPPPPPDGRDDEPRDLVYRNTRIGEHPNALVTGLWAKNPSATYSPQYHVSHGNKANTQWISTSRNKLWTIAYNEGTPIYVINLKKVQSTIVDLTLPGALEGWSPRTANLARRASEVLIEKHIQPQAIEEVLSSPISTQ